MDVGKIVKVAGPLVVAEGMQNAKIYDVVRVSERKLMGEIIEMRGEEASIQVYEETGGLGVGEPVYITGNPLSVELGPGLIESIYDGIQRPLDMIRETAGDLITRGIDIPGLSRERKWTFKPSARVGDKVEEGDVLGTVDETVLVVHKIMVPPGVNGTLKSIERKECTVTETVAVVETGRGEDLEIGLMTKWPVRKPRPYKEKLAPDEPLSTGQRVIDAFFPISKGGTACIPGPFGSGKTVVQHQLAKWADAQIIVYVGCGERGNEMTDVLMEFPKLIDPHSGEPLMKKTILIANTSNMPVAAREASVYTGITLAEYYRDMGYSVALMADSTSRWAEALRELSGRMEEMPAEEGFPAYLPTRVAEFYERAGYMKTMCDKTGSVTIIGAISPPGGDFSEPVTQHTKRFIRCFWALDRGLANARHYPAISWIDSYTEYLTDISAWWGKNVSSEWEKDRALIMELLQKEVRLQQVVKLVGPDALPDSQRFVLDVCTLFKNSFLQQNAFDKVDMFSTLEKQVKMLHVILTYWRRGREAIKRGATLVKLRRMKVYQDIAKMKFTVPDADLSALDKIQARLERSMDQLETIYA
ncbi:hypothetical protein LCGC14_1971550 [marine sediment metagenome]|uniref:H(+)-transporting two-sector ATPase n=1 Tax=marine sediment metagenome TaxID=412755 RepID=A0A0F9FZT3_9ZZZZ